MLLSEIREYLKTKVESPQWYLNKVGDKEQSITIYNTTGPVPVIAIGGLENTSYTTKTISILVHWGKDSNKAELKAQEVYSALFGQDGIIGEKRVIQFKMKTDSPIYVGTDSEGIIEYVIETIIYYER
ncbi:MULTISPECIES: phage tail terminator protein [Clostridium]|uniref:phage tail terminator protein n=1 Tax=Clostridium TaxID=1485 RepID=UPI00232AE47C|nr:MULTISPECIES: minor capsid protein [Clostridium]MDB2118974.1 minor capsid protein [Clostridium paraputrificum]MDU2755675.1 minor capsid protein [Clostridium sp.]MDU2901885.1 minor capsid protein [Clostridium sp.]